MMMRPQKWRRIMSTYCQTNASLIKDYVPVRIIDIISVRQAFETVKQIDSNGVIGNCLTWHRYHLVSKNGMPITAVTPL